MNPRLNPYEAMPEAMKALVGLDNYVQQSGLAFPDRSRQDARFADQRLCLLHPYAYGEARARSETEERLHLLAWRESTHYTERERAPLGWTEAVTLVSQNHVPDQIYKDARRHFTAAEPVKLTIAIATVNAWNRIAIGFRAVHPVRNSHVKA